ncbi:MAG: solute carrier family 23 protein, partial [Patescibacteria group bacterium]
TMIDPLGNLPHMKEGLIVDGLGTIAGATVGPYNLITYVESAVGFGEGGRTGLVAVVIAILMSAFLFLIPVINLIPVAATTGALFFVGLGLLPKVQELKSYSKTDNLAILAMILVTFLTFGLDKAMFAGFAVFVLLLILGGQWRQVNRYLAASTVLLLLSILLSGGS